MKNTAAKCMGLLLAFSLILAGIPADRVHAAKSKLSGYFLGRQLFGRSGKGKKDGKYSYIDKKGKTVLQ